MLNLLFKKYGRIRIRVVFRVRIRIRVFSARSDPGPVSSQRSDPSKPHSDPQPIFIGSSQPPKLILYQDDIKITFLLKWITFLRKASVSHYFFSCDFGYRMRNQVRQNKDKLSKKQRQKDKHANRLTDKQGDTQKYLLVKIFRYWPNFLSGSQNMTKNFSCEKKHLRQKL